AERADGGAQVLVVARDEQPTAPPAKAADPAAVVGGEAVAAVHGEQPELVDVRRVEDRQDGIVTARGAGARDDVEARRAAGVAQRGEVIAQQREPPDVPVVACRRDGGLQQDTDRSAHDDLWAQKWIRLKVNRYGLVSSSFGRRRAR